MAKAKELVPVEIAVVDQTVAKMTEYASNSASADRSLRNNSGACWGTTVLWFERKVGLSTFDATKSQDDIAEDIRVAYKEKFLAEYGELPSMVVNARTGETVPLVNAKTKDIIWSSWEATKLPISYCSDLANVVKAGKTDILIQSETECLGRSDIRKICKVAETALGACERGVALIDDNFGGLSAVEMEMVAEKLQAITEKISDAMELTAVPATGTDGK